MDSADKGAGVDEGMVVLPTDPGGPGVAWSDGLGEPAGDSASFCFLNASAWRLGGPRRRLGRS